MTGSCERSACGSARPVADAIWSFAALRPDMTGSRPTRQGVSSTDKYVMPRCDASGMVGGFSSLVRRIDGVPAFGRCPAAPYTVARLSRSVATLVDGRCGRGLDTDAVWVKLPLGEGKRAVRRADSAGARPGGCRRQWFAASIEAVSRRRPVGRPLRQGGPFPALASIGTDGRSGSGGGPSPDPMRNKAGTPAL